MPDIPNATPTNYNSAYTGPQIDAAVGAVLDKEAVWDAAYAGKLPAGGEIGQVLEKTGAEDNAADWRTPPFLTRPNLLDNWYFVGGGSQLGDGVFPINQRGQINYTGAGYTIDRWRLSGANNALEIATNKITISDTGGAPAALFQDIVPGDFAGKQATMSALSASGELFTVTGVVPSPLPSSYTVVAQIADKIRVAVSQTYLRAQLYGGEWVAVKLELGNTQTLAHQENGVWVLNELPDFVEELASCQRYMFAIGGIFRERAAFIGPNLIQFSIPCPPQLALAPSAGAIAIEQGENLTIAAINSSVAQAGFSFNVLGRSTKNPAIIVNAEKTGHGLSDAQICITTTTKKVIFSVT